MISTSFRVALSALFFAGAMGLASIGAARAESVMKECGDDWKAAKANSTTNGMTWQEFLKQCRTQKESSAAPAAAPPPPVHHRPHPRPANLPAEARPGANGGSRDRGRPIHHRGGGAGALPVR